MNHSSSDRIVADLRRWVAQAPPGARLPSTRDLVAQYAASPVTVQKALRALTSQGLIEARVGVGTFVRAVRTARPLDYGWQSAALGAPRRGLTMPASALRPASNDSIALHSGYPERGLLPERLVRSALTRASRNDAALTRSPAAGVPELQTWFADQLGRATPAGLTPPSPADVIVLPGSQSGLSAVFRSLVPPGQPLLIESPTYWGALLAAAQAGLQVVPIPSGPRGPDTDALARAFEETGARMFYAQPSYANPTGAQWTPATAQRVLDLVREHGAFLVEDDWAHDFGIDTDPSPVAALDDSGHVIYLRSLTKSVSPALRIAAVIARGPARERILADRAAESMYVSGVLQVATLDVVTQPAWASHLRALRHQLRDRRDLLLSSLRQHAPLADVAAVPSGGLNLWARLPDAVDLDRLVLECESRGVLVAPGDEWFPAEPAGQYIRLNYSGPNPGAFPEAAVVIGEAITRAL